MIGLLINFSLCVVTALKHSPSKRKSLSRPLRAHEEADANSKFNLNTTVVLFYLIFLLIVYKCK